MRAAILAVLMMAGCAESRTPVEERVYFVADELVERADADAVCADLGAELASAADAPDDACEGMPCWISEATVGNGPTPVAHPLCVVTIAR